MSIVEQSFKELYLLKRKQDSPPPENKFECVYCDADNFVYDEKYAETICTKCGTVQHFTRRCVYHSGYLPDTFSKVKKSEYKQVDYVKLRLTELQCGIMKLDANMMDTLRHHFKDKTLDIYTLRKALNNYGFKQMYLRIPVILYTLAPEKFPPLKLTSRQVAKIVGLFKSYLAKWNMLTQSERLGRKNILNYQFVLKKIFIQLGLEDKVHFLTIPRGKKTLKQHERIWNTLSQKTL